MEPGVGRYWWMPRLKSNTGMPTERSGQRQVDPALLGSVVWTAETFKQMQGNVHYTKEHSGNPHVVEV